MQITSLSNEERDAIAEIVPELIRKCLNQHTTWAKQNEAAQKAFVQHAIASMPFLSDYDSAWPAQMYARERLYKWTPESPSTASNIGNRLQTSSRQIAAGPYSGLHRAEHAASKSRARHGCHEDKEKPKCIARSPSIEILDHPGVTGCQDRSTKWIRGVRQSLPYPRSQVSRRTSSRSSFSSASSSTQIVDHVRLDTFLSDIHPCMSSLKPILVDGGILDEDHLDGLAALPPHEQDEFLRVDLGLQLFQARMLRRGLEERSR